MTALFVTLIILGYFLPFIVAKYRRHKNTVPIFLTTVFFGWTGIGWVAALIWASSYQGGEI